MAIYIRRREFIVAALGGAAVWPLAPRAQPTLPIIGFLYIGSEIQARDRSLVTAFQRGLNEIGFVEGQNVAIEYRWAEGHYDRLPALAAELVHRQVRCCWLP